MEPERRLVWGDSQGSREYTLGQRQGDAVIFTMREKLGGLLFPCLPGLFRRSTSQLNNLRLI
jgi:hypothetical protein